MEYYSVIIKNAIMPFEVTWRDIEVFILSELVSLHLALLNLYIQPKILGARDVVKF